ncbi:hypothetical protein TSOC_001383 [Tetrabaena socialis]|uniref:Protein kinase domain-containing protein n=1 Tax=Tetrabaena socialis TaxID=47790 RepID=A0A2J8AGX1_9CHLO|nr:hypothetical protein TSOC_001383 [Tetrabaena socialis]|eukprot:PNH11768.1 hypothetical protein TSOC_001383 [Tetrabaena socialis]
MPRWGFLACFAPQAQESQQPIECGRSGKAGSVKQPVAAGQCCGSSTFGAAPSASSSSTSAGNHAEDNTPAQNALSSLSSGLSDSLACAPFECTAPSRTEPQVPSIAPTLACGSSGITTVQSLAAGLSGNGHHFLDARDGAVASTGPSSFLLTSPFHSSAAVPFGSDMRESNGTVDAALSAQTLSLGTLGSPTPESSANYNCQLPFSVCALSRNAASIGDGQQPGLHRLSNAGSGVNGLPSSRRLLAHSISHASSAAATARLPSSCISMHLRASNPSTTSLTFGGLHNACSRSDIGLYTVAEAANIASTSCLLHHMAGGAAEQPLAIMSCFSADAALHCSAVAAAEPPEATATAAAAAPPAGAAEQPLATSADAAVHCSAVAAVVPPTAAAAAAATAPPAATTTTVPTAATTTVPTAAATTAAAADCASACIAPAPVAPAPPARRVRGAPGQMAYSSPFAQQHPHSHSYGHGQRQQQQQQQPEPPPWSPLSLERPVCLVPPPVTALPAQQSLHLRAPPLLQLHPLLQSEQHPELSGQESSPTVGTPFSPGHPADNFLRFVDLETCWAELRDLSFLGSGSSGNVYSGTWCGVTVAVKFMLSGDVGLTQRQQREAALSRLASHPHLVQTYAVAAAQLQPHHFSSADLSAARRASRLSQYDLLCSNVGGRSTAADLYGGSTVGSRGPSLDMGGRGAAAINSGGGGGAGSHLSSGQPLQRPHAKLVSHWMAASGGGCVAPGASHGMIGEALGGRGSTLAAGQPGPGRATVPRLPACILSSPRGALSNVSRVDRRNRLAVGPAAPPAPMTSPPPRSGIAAAISTVDMDVGCGLQTTRGASSGLIGRGVKGSTPFVVPLVRRLRASPPPPQRVPASSRGRSAAAAAAAATLAASLMGTSLLLPPIREDRELLHEDMMFEHEESGVRSAGLQAALEMCGAFGALDQREMRGRQGRGPSLALSAGEHLAWPRGCVGEWSGPCFGAVAAS